MDYLQGSGFLGSSLVNLGAAAFQVGEAFLQFITFMGCSPHIEMEPPPQGGPFCYVHIDGPWLRPLLRHGRNTQAPRCSACRGRITSWRELLPAWLERPQDPLIDCPRCGHRQCPLDLGWRREAGFGQLFIVVEDIFPGEAVPVPALLSNLKGMTASPWQYFYVRD
jgi:DNA-directed RNA polymerase subunit RPC12/RpoP